MIKFNSSPDPITFHKLTIREAINQLCELIEPTMTSLGLKKYIKTIEDILKIGTGSTRQRQLYSHASSFKYMIRSLKEQFYQ